MNQTDLTPIRLCALADLLLVCNDALRLPHRAAPRLVETSAAFPELLAAAGAAADSPLATAFQRLVARSAETNFDSWSAEYHRLFEGAMLCPLNQTAYVRRDKGAVIGDLCGFYHAFGFAPAANIGEKPDYLLTEIEFLALLLVMLSQAQGESRDITRQAITALAQDHLCDWLAAAWERLALVTSLPYYVSVAEVLCLTWEHVSLTLGLPPTQPAIEPEVQPEEPYECGMSPSAPAELQIRATPLLPS